MHKKRKTSKVHSSSRKPTKKCAMKMKQTRKKQHKRKNVIHERKPFITAIRKSGENDLHEESWGNDYGYNEDIILFSKRLNWW